MERYSAELREFSDLITAVITETALLKNVILSEEAGKEEAEILRGFNSAIQTQAFSSLTNLAIYQLRGWRAVIDG